MGKLQTALLSRQPQHDPVHSGAGRRRGCMGVKGLQQVTERLSGRFTLSRGCCNITPRSHRAPRRGFSQRRGACEREEARRQQGRGSAASHWTSLRSLPTQDFYRAFPQKACPSSLRGSPLETSGATRPHVKHPTAGQPDALIFTWHPVKLQGLLPQPEDFNLSINKKLRIEEA